MALIWHFSQGELGATLEKVFITVATEKVFITLAFLGMIAAVLSREYKEDERVDLIRLRVGLMVIGGFLGSFALVQLWIADGPEEAVSIPVYSLFGLATYLIGLEIYKRVV
jgi:hypothetical protein